jgi:hypothetical protein
MRHYFSCHVCELKGDDKQRMRILLAMKCSNTKKAGKRRPPSSNGGYRTHKPLGHPVEDLADAPPAILRFGM